MYAKNRKKEKQTLLFSMLSPSRPYTGATGEHVIVLKRSSSPSCHGACVLGSLSLQLNSTFKRIVQYFWGNNLNSLLTVKSFIWKIFQIFFPLFNGGDFVDVNLRILNWWTELEAIFDTTDTLSRGAEQEMVPQLVTFTQFGCRLNKCEGMYSSVRFRGAPAHRFTFRQSRDQPLC